MLVMRVFLKRKALNQSDVIGLDYQENSKLGWGFWQKWINAVMTALRLRAKHGPQSHGYG